MYMPAWYYAVGGVQRKSLLHAYIHICIVHTYKLTAESGQSMHWVRPSLHKSRFNIVRLRFVTSWHVINSTSINNYQNNAS